MGKTQSRIITLDEARKRCSVAEWERFCNGFDRIANKAGLVDRDTFKEWVMSKHLPNELNDRIYHVFATKKQQGGIDKEEFLCGMTIFSKGTPEERIRFLFYVYDDDNSGSISRTEMTRYMNVLKDTLITLKNLSPQERLTECFDKVDVNQDSQISWNEFKEWAHKNMTPGLITWIWELTPKDIVEPNTMDFASESLRTGQLKEDQISIWRGRAFSVANVTHFSDKEITELQKQYHKMRATSPQVDKATLAAVFSPSLPEEILQRIFSAFPQDANGAISVRDFIIGFSSCCRGSTEERLQFCFRAFDDNNDGKLSSEEFHAMVQSLWQLGAVHASLTYDSPSARPTSTTDDKRPSLHHLVHRVFDEYDSDDDGCITFSQFRTWTEQNRVGMDFFAKIKEFASVHLGIRPVDVEEERGMIQHYLQQQPPVQLGDEFFIISSKWASAYLSYIGLPSDAFDTAFTLNEDRKHTMSTPRKSTNSGSPAMNGHITGSPIVNGHINVSPVRPTHTHKPSEQKDISKISTAERENLRPGPIDNSDILESDEPPTDTISPIPPPPTSIPSSDARFQPRAILKRDLRKGVDYTVIPESVWTPLVNWYTGGPEIRRKIIRAGAADSSTLILEMYPLVIRCRTAASSKYIQLNFSRSATIAELRDELCKLCTLDPQRIRIWDMGTSETPHTEPRLYQEHEMNLTLEDAQIAETGQELFLDLQLENGRWQGHPRVNVGNNGVNGMNGTDVNGGNGMKKEMDVKSYTNGGLCGLYNLGNTCFMNSAVQCLSLTRPLTDYFLLDLYTREINTTSVLGMKGQMAIAYAKTLKAMWSARPFDAISPKTLKWTIGKFRPQFVGSQQHDAQELLSFLMDGLHEDLNRVRVPPYVTNPDSDGRPDSIVSTEQWHNYGLRHQSVIVDLFTAQLKSTLLFSCGRTSVTFDPYNCLSLPLPKPNNRFIEIIVIYHLASRPPQRFSIEIHPTRRIADLKQALATLSGIPANRLQLADVHNNIIFNFPFSHAWIAEIRVTDQIYAYELAGRRDDMGSEEPQSNVPDARPDIRVGQHFDVRDTVNKWLAATLVEIRVIPTYPHPHPPPPTRSSVTPSPAIQPTRSSTSTINPLSTTTPTPIIPTHPRTSLPTVPGIVPSPTTTTDDDDDSSIVPTFHSADATGPTAETPTLTSTATTYIATTSTTSTTTEPYITGTRHEMIPASMGEDGNVRVYLKFHYEGWDAKWDEWLPKGSERIAPFGTETAGMRRYRHRHDELDIDPKFVCIHAVHRRLIPVTHYFINPYVPQLLHIPLLLYINPSECTNARLYELIWNKCRRFTMVPNEDGTQNVFTSLDHRQSTTSETKSDDSRMEPTGSPYPPFTLKRVNRQGLACSQCTWLKLCLGCTIDFSDEIIRWDMDSTIAIDWNPVFFAKYFNVNELKEVWDHASVIEHRRILNTSISFGDCMARFTAPEPLIQDASGDARVYCSACKTHENATKTLELWSTPPILIIHLKRLLPDRKLYTMVEFPMRGFDPTPFLASQTDYAPPKHVPEEEEKLDPVDEKDEKTTSSMETDTKEPIQPVATTIASSSRSTSHVTDTGIGIGMNGSSRTSVTSTQPQLVAQAPRTRNTVDVADVDMTPMDLNDTTPHSPTTAFIHPQSTSTPSHSSKTSPSSSPAAAAAPIPTTTRSTSFMSRLKRRSTIRDQEQRKKRQEHYAKQMEPTQLYDLYAVVNHFGAGGGGHYTAFGKVKEQWYKFDDHHVKLIDEDKVITSSAYMLFYVRRGTSSLDCFDHLPAEIRAKLGTSIGSATGTDAIDGPIHTVCPRCNIQ